MAILKNRAWMTTATAGTGTITLGSALSGYQTFAAAGVANADVVPYTIIDGAAWEIGTGTYTAAGTTLSRTLDESSTGALISLSGSATVFITARDVDILNPANNLSDVANAATAFTNIKQAASTSATGVVQLADAAAMEALTASRAVTADIAHRSPSTVKAWALGDNTTTLNASYNVSSNADNGAGDHTFNLTTAFSSGNFSPVASALAQNASHQSAVYSISTTSVRVVNSDGSAYADPITGYSFHACGDQ